MLTIGMATYDDYDGVYFTVQALRMYHPEIVDCEIVVVDNNPTGKAGGHIKNLLEHSVKNSGGLARVRDARYIPMEEPKGTTQSRNRIFAEARGDAVLVMDSHVLLAPGSLGKLLEFYDTNDACPDLLSGPMMYDHLDANNVNTHFDDFWRAEMWGIWGQAWGCKCRMPQALHFTVLNTNSYCDYRHLAMGLEPVRVCQGCGNELPLMPHAGHQKRLLELGFVSLGSAEGPPFRIPGQGLGLFSCRREAWLGFNPHFRGFGGEEMYIHEKYRKAGYEALCLPFLKWGHRFGRPNGVPYVSILTRWNKIRNYVLGHQELGLPLDPVYNHFVPTKLIPRWEWDSLIEDPVGREAGPHVAGGIKHLPPELAKASPPKNSCGPQREQPRATINSEGELLAWCRTLPRDLDRHLDKLAELAAQCDHVTEVTHRRESTVALLAAKQVVSYQGERDALIQRLLDIFPHKLDVRMVEVAGHTPLEIQWDRQTDMLFLDTVANGQRFAAELQAYAPHVRRWIAVHDTSLNAYQGEGERAAVHGMLLAMTNFMKANPEWSVIYHTKEQYGLTVLSRDPRDKPKLPGVLTLATNFAKAVTEHVKTGGKEASHEEYERRLGICSVCPQRTDNNCSVCGCGLRKKASWAESECPLGLWAAGHPLENPSA